MDDQITHKDSSSQDFKPEPTSPACHNTQNPHDHNHDHPRSNLAEWKWKGTIAVIFLTSMINGYDVSNVANIQPRLHEAFGNIQLLPWIGLSYSLANFSVLSLARKITYCADMKLIYLCSMVIFTAGAAIAGSASSMISVIVGRVIMGIGGAIVQQTNMSYMAVFAAPSEMTPLFATMSAMWAVGLVVGGPLGSALAESKHATWRWAFYLNLPLVGFGIIIALCCIPNHKFYPKTPILQRILSIDPLGITFNIVTPVLFAIACTFSGPIWDWGSAASCVIWSIFIVVSIAWTLQQWFCILTSPRERAFPVHMLRRLDLMPIWIASGCAGASYAITLYYLPLYFAFVRGHGALQQTVHMLPFILVFIVAVLLIGGLLPIIGRYKIIYMSAGAITLAGAAAMVTTLDSSVSEAQIMGLEGLLGLGLGMHFQHGFGISNVINKDPQDRLDSSIVCNMAQMGGIAGILAVAGSIFQNVGFSLLTDAIGANKYSENDVREALAGVSSVIWQSKDIRVLQKGAGAVAQVVAREFYIVLAAGALCLVCGIFMRWEKLDFGNKMKKAHEDCEST